MTDPPTEPAGAHTAFRVLAALADLGEATAAAIAEHAELGYSTVTPKLRAWETSGHAEKYRNGQTNQTLWRLTEAGRATTATPAEHTLPEHTPPDAPEPAPLAHPNDDEEPGSGTAEQEDPDAATMPGPAIPDGHGQPDGDDKSDSEASSADVAVAEPGPATPAGAAGDESDPVEAAGSTEHASADDTAPVAQQPAPTAKRKRPAGALEASLLAILQSRPDDQFTVNDLRKLVDKADETTGYPAASAGAIANALTKLTGKGDIDTVTEKPATFQAAPTTD